MNAAETKLSSDAIEALSIHHIMLGSSDFATCFLSLLPISSARAILKSLLTSQLPKSFRPVKKVSGSYYFRWLCSRLLTRYGGALEYSPDLDTSFRLSMVETPPKSVKTLESMLDSRKFSYSDQARFKFAQAFLAFASDCPAMARWLLPTLSIEFQRLSLVKLYCSLGSTCFSLFPDHSSVDFRNLRLSYQNDSEHEIFWLTDEVYRHVELGHHYQRCICGAHRYPDVSLFTETFSLAHTTVLECAFFVDLVRDAMKKLVTSGDFSGAYAQGAILKEMNTWVFVSLFPGIVERFEDVAEQLASVEFERESLCGELLERLQNDEKLLKTIRNVSGSRIARRDFADVSIGFVVASALKGCDPTVFTDLSTNRLFCMTDRERIIDADWIWGYFALRYCVEMIQGCSDGVERNPERIEWCLLQIQGEEVRQNVIRDLFSLIFLRENGKFLCTASTAEAVLMLLMNASDDRELSKYLRAGHQNLQVMKLLSNGDCLENATTSKRAQLVRALFNKDWVIAERISSLSADDQEIMKLFKTVADHATSGEKFVPEDGNDQISVEIAMSFPNETCAIESASKVANPVVLKVLTECSEENRFGILNKDSESLITKLNSKLTRLTASSWPIPTLPKTVEFTLLRSFFEYLDSLLPVLFSVHPGDSLYDVLAISPWSVVDHLLHCGQIENAAAMSGNLGMDLKEKIVQNLTYPEHVIMKFTGDVPAIPFLASMIGNWPEFKCPNDTCSRIRENRDRLLGKTSHPTSFETLSNKIEWFDMNTEDGYTSEMAAGDLENLLKTKGSDEEIIELCYRARESDIYRVFDSYLSNDNIEYVVEILRQCPVNFEYLSQKQIMAQLCKSGLNPFSRESCFRSLLEQKRYDEASIFFSLCHANGFDEILRDHCRTTKDLNALKVSPDMYKELWTLFETETDIPDVKADMPNYWRSDKGSKVDIIQRHISEYHHVQMYLQKHLECDCDDVIVEYARKQSAQEASIPQKINVLGRVMHIYWRCFRNPEKVLVIFQQELIHLLAQLDVKSEDAENTIFWCLGGVIPSLVRLSKVYARGTACLDELVFAYQFVSEFTFHRFGNSYSFDGLGTRKFGERMLDQCRRIDFHELALEINRICRIPLDDVVVSWLIDSCAMSLSDEGLSGKLRPLSQLTSSDMNERDRIFENFEKELLFASAFDPYVIELCREFPPAPQSMTILCDFDSQGDSARICKRSWTMENISLSHWHHRIASLSKGLVRPKPGKEQTNAIEILLKNYATMRSKARFLARQGKWESALETVSAAGEYERCQVFQTVFLTALQSIQFSRFRDALLKLDPNHERYRICMQKIAEEADKNKNLHLLLFCHEYFGDNVLTAMTSISIFNSTSATSDSLKYLAIAELALEQELNDRSNGKTTFEVPSEKIQSDLEAIDLQRRFTMYFIENRLPAYDGLTLFDTPSKKEDMIVLLLRNREFSISLEIMQKYNLRKRPISIKIADSLFGENPNEIPRFLKSLWKFKDIYSEFVYTMVTRVWFVHMDHRLALQLLGEVKYPDLKCKLMIQLGYLDNAADVAIQYALRDLLPLIAHTALAQMNFALATRCVSALGNR